MATRDELKSSASHKAAVFGRVLRDVLGHRLWFARRATTRCRNPASLVLVVLAASCTRGTEAHPDESKPDGQPAIACQVEDAPDVSRAIESHVRAAGARTELVAALSARVPAEGSIGEADPVELRAVTHARVQDGELLVGMVRKRGHAQCGVLRLGGAPQRRGGAGTLRVEQCLRCEGDSDTAEAGETLSVMVRRYGATVGRTRGVFGYGSVTDQEVATVYGGRAVVARKVGVWVGVGGLDFVTSSSGSRFALDGRRIDSDVVCAAASHILCSMPLRRAQSDGSEFWIELLTEGIRRSSVWDDVEGPDPETEGVLTALVRALALLAHDAASEEVGRVTARIDGSSPAVRASLRTLRAQINAELGVTRGGGNRTER